MKIFATDQAGGWMIPSHQPTLRVAFAKHCDLWRGMKIAPPAQMDDDRLDGWVIGGIDSFRFACMFPQASRGRHLHMRKVNYSEAAHPARGNGNSAGHLRRRRIRLPYTARGEDRARGGESAYPPAPVLNFPHG
jgi:hypothetical protein